MGEIVREEREREREGVDRGGEIHVGREEREGRRRESGRDSQGGEREREGGDRGGEIRVGREEREKGRRESGRDSQGGEREREGGERVGEIVRKERERGKEERGEEVCIEHWRVSVAPILQFVAD